MSKKSKSQVQSIKSRSTPTLKKGSFFSIETLKNFIETREKIILLSLTLLALVIRLYRLGYLSFWVDEYMHVNRAVSFLKDFNPTHLFEGEKNGLLVTVLNVLGFALFGKNEFGGRIFMVLLGTALVPVIYYFCKILFNRPVALLSAILVVFSQYLIYWSRLDRQYGPIPTIYLLLVLSTILYVHRDYIQAARITLFRKFNVYIGSFGFLFFIGLLAFATNFISYFIGFSFGIYCIILWIYGLGKEPLPPNKKRRIVIISCGSLLFFILSFTPLNTLILKPILLQLMPENMVNLILPNFEYIKSKLTSADKFYYFKVYWGVITTDLPYMIYFAIAGMLTLAYSDFRKFIILFAYYIPPFLLMSFVFLDPCLPRYHTFIYPLFIISTACAFYYIPAVLSERLAPGNAQTRNQAFMISTIAFIIMLFVSKALVSPFKVVNTDNHGATIDRKLSIWYFTNWKEPSIYIKKNIRKGDIVFSTVPDAVNFYINQQNQYNVYLFRQLKLNPANRDYVPIGNSPSIPSASSADDLYKTIQSFTRIWLIADYYIYNSLTDSRAREMVFQNFTFFPEACKDGSVQLFLWEANQPKKFEYNTLIELGKPTGRQMSPAISLQATQEQLSKGVGITIQSTGIDSDQEAFIQINNGDHFNIPKPKSKGQNNLGISELRIPGNKLKSGQNILVFNYNAVRLDTYKGFIIYNIKFN